MAGIRVAWRRPHVPHALHLGHARWAEAVEAWLDALFPPRCAGCGRAGSHFCSTCAGAVKPVPPPWCASCGAPLLRGDHCAECRLDPLPLAAVRSGGLMEGPLRRAIHGLKYRGQRAAARSLADLLRPPAQALALPPAEAAGLLALPIPLHPSRERERGYNQAALLARPLAAALGVAYESRALRRVAPTASQVGLSRRQRRANLRSAFAASPEVQGRPALLVDDVATTGSTLGSAAQACLAAGATRVYAVTLAREA